MRRAEPSSRQPGCFWPSAIPNRGTRARAAPPHPRVIRRGHPNGNLWLAQSGLAWNHRGGRNGARRIWLGRGKQGARALPERMNSGARGEPGMGRVGAGPRVPRLAAPAPAQGRLNRQARTFPMRRGLLLVLALLLAAALPAGALAKGGHRGHGYLPHHHGHIFFRHSFGWPYPAWVAPGAPAWDLWCSEQRHLQKEPRGCENLGPIAPTTPPPALPAPAPHQLPQPGS